MTDMGTEEPHQHPSAEPTSGGDERDASEPFWDFKASHWTTAVLTGVIVLVGFFQLCIYARQAGIMETQTAISVATNRAFVNFDTFVFVSIDTGAAGPGKVVGIWFTVINSGNVSTKEFEAIVSCKAVPSTEPQTEPFELFKWEESKTTPEAVGPKQKSNIGSDECQRIKPDTIRDVQFGRSLMYLLGEVRYRDRIDPKPLHKTRISQQLFVSAVSTDDKGVIHFNVSTDPRGRNNCVDEDCP